MARTWCDEQKPVGNANAHHEVGKGFAFSAGATDRADSVTLGVHAPEAEVRPQPFRGNRSVPVTREPADLVEALPGVLLPFQPLDSLRLRFLDCFQH